MPQLIQHIDKIARDVRRTVLYVKFHHPRKPGETDVPATSPGDIDYQHLPIRQKIIEWLKEHGIGWQPCAEFANVNYMGPYTGDIYVDVPMDEQDPRYQAMLQFMEYEDGTMRHPDATWFYLPLEKAVTNAHHDEPGFWERWAKTF